MSYVLECFERLRFPRFGIGASLRVKIAQSRDPFPSLEACWWWPACGGAEAPECVPPGKKACVARNEGVCASSGMHRPRKKMAYVRY